MILHGPWAEPLGPGAHRAHRCSHRRLQPGTCQSIEETRCKPRVGDTSNAQAWGCFINVSKSFCGIKNSECTILRGFCRPDRGIIYIAPHWRWLPIEVIVTERTRRRPRRGHRRCGSAMPVRTPRSWACACTGHVHVPLDRADACTWRVHATTGTGVPCMV